MNSFEESIEIAAPAEAVWDVAGKPGQIAEWLPALTSSEVTGSERHCTLADGGELEEKIIEHSDDERRYTYEITTGPMPIASHRSTFSVSGENGGSRVEWDAQFETEQPEQADEVGEMLRSTYREGLESLRDRVEAGTAA